MPFRYLLLILLVILGCRQAAKRSENPYVIIKTSAGNIEIELYEKQAPKSVAAFLANVDSGLYQNATFYRVLNRENQPTDAFKATLIQGGLWRTHRERSVVKKGIPHETTRQTGILHKDGVISFARLGPGTATTEFFICIGEQPGFNYGGLNNPDRQGYAAFGRVWSGMKVVNYIYNRKEYDQLFDPPVVIYNIVRM